MFKYQTTIDKLSATRFIPEGINTFFINDEIGKKIYDTLTQLRDYMRLDKTKLLEMIDTTPNDDRRRLAQSLWKYLAIFDEYDYKTIDKIQIAINKFSENY